MVKKKAKILILYTGGTFGMDAETLAIPNLSPKALEKRLIRRVPELRDLANCQVKIQMNRDSAHLGPEQWVLIAQSIQKSWGSVDGVVVLHGTDTLAYTASALSFLLGPCKKPVILTGAQRPLSALRSDARRNLISAVELAACGFNSLEHRIHQVCIFFNETLFQGNRTRKRSAVDFSGFESPKASVLARVGTSIQISKTTEPSAHRGKKSKLPSLKPSFSDRVAMIHLTPGFPSLAVRKILPDLDGLILVAFPSGTAPTHSREFLNLLKEAQKLDLPVMIATEGIGVTGSEYQAGREMLERGCLWSGAMTPECAYVKASILLGQGKGRDFLRKWWGTEFAAEGVSQRSLAH